MGRTDELREVFRRRAMERRPDPELVAFQAVLNEVIAPKGAVVFYSSNDWLCTVFERARGIPDEQLRAWIEAETVDLFLSKAKPPHWPADQAPDWCFHDGKPLTFIGQMPDPGEDDEIYLFEGRIDIVDEEGQVTGWRRFYKMRILGLHDGSETILQGTIRA